MLLERKSKKRIKYTVVRRNSEAEKVKDNCTKRGEATGDNTRRSYKNTEEPISKHFTLINATEKQYPFQFVFTGKVYTYRHP